MYLYIVRRVPPHFSIPPENAEVLPGGAVNLTCVAIGSPMPFVRWRLGAVELTPEDNPPIGKNILQLTDVRETATYTCVATSDLGNIEYDAEVRVKGTATLGTNRSLAFILFVVLAAVCKQWRQCRGGREGARCRCLPKFWTFEKLSEHFCLKMFAQKCQIWN